MRCERWPTSRDYLTRADGGAVLRVHALEHAHGAADRAEWIAQFVTEHRQELVCRVAVALGAIAIAAGLEERAEVRHNQAQAASALRHRGREREIYLNGSPARGDQATPMGSAAGAQQRNEIGSVGFRHEAADVPAKHRLQRLADKSREACVGIQNVAGLREDDGTLPHLFDEVTVRFLGAVERVDLVAFRSPDDQRIDLTFTKARSVSSASARRASSVSRRS
jgi:hypothetical protein